jgi:hypothetical protein
MLFILDSIFLKSIVFLSFVEQNIDDLTLPFMIMFKKLPCHTT